MIVPHRHSGVDHWTVREALPARIRHHFGGDESGAGHLVGTSARIEDHAGAPSPVRITKPFRAAVTPGAKRAPVLLGSSHNLVPKRSGLAASSTTTAAVAVPSVEVDPAARGLGTTTWLGAGPNFV
jgi:hypothetical protein